MNNASNTTQGNPGLRAREFDLAAIRHHAQSLGAIPPHTLARLRAARHAATTRAAPARGIGWMLAGGCAAVFALAIALQLQRSPTDTPQPVQTAATDAADDAGDSRDAEVDGVIALDENPDLYLWLAANDDALPPPAGQWP